MKLFYFDTSIWLDLIENRDEPNLPKGEWAHKLLNKIIKNDYRIIYSDINLIELKTLGYSTNEIYDFHKKLRSILIFTVSSNKQRGIAKDLSLKRNVPRRDALHALIARDNKAILITLDKHFQRLKDITKPKSSKEFI